MTGLGFGGFTALIGRRDPLLTSDRIAKVDATIGADGVVAGEKLARQTGRGVNS
jgi:hypothetical protein